MLSDHSIRELCQNEKLIEPYSDSHLQPCSYDVRLSDEIIRFIGHGTIKLSDRSFSGEYFKLNMNEHGYILEPGEFILGSTIEKVKLPNNIAARFEGKSSLGRIGLATHVTAGFIDPGFEGTITLEIKNLNQYPILLETGCPIGQLCFFKLDSEVEKPYGSDGLNSKYQGQHGPTISKDLS